MTVYISPNPGKAMAYGISQRAAQILLTHGAQVLMQDGLQAECMTMGVEYLPQKECLERTDVILTIGGDGTILHEANLSLEYRKPILGINLEQSTGTTLEAAKDVEPGSSAWLLAGISVGCTVGAAVVTVLVLRVHARLKKRRKTAKRRNKA